jgi:hypothetical protein
MSRSSLACLILVLLSIGCAPQREETSSSGSDTLTAGDSMPRGIDPPTRDTSAIDTTAGPELMRTVGEVTMRREGEWYRAVIPYTYTNRTGDSVYLTNCNGDVSPSLQRRVDGKWTGWWYPVMNECLSPPVVIAPGAVYRDSLGIMLGRQDREVYEQLVAARSLEVRLDWQQALTSFSAEKYPFGPQLPLEQRVSNAFTLRIE